jgi:Zn-dependent protease with chaperone function
VPRHPWEPPLLALAVAVTAAVAAAAVHTLWTGTPPLRWAAAAVLALPPAAWAVRGLAHARQCAHAVRLSPTQFPDAHRVVREVGAEMGLGAVPDVYVRPGPEPGARVAGHGPRRCVVVSSAAFGDGGRLHDPAALRFLVAHQLGHVRAGHTSPWWRLGTAAAWAVPGLGSSLARAMEYTADDHAHAHCPEGAHAVRLMAAGRHLYPQVSPGELAERARTDRGLFVFLYTLLSPRPALTRRMAALHDRSRPGRLLL